jgi:hypothetical protein
MRSHKSPRPSQAVRCKSAGQTNKTRQLCSRSNTQACANLKAQSNERPQRAVHTPGPVPPKSPTLASTALPKTRKLSLVPNNRPPKCWLRAAKVGRQTGTNNGPQSCYSERKAPPASRSPEAFCSKSPVRPTGLFLSMSPFMSLAVTIGTAARLRRWQINL